MTQPIAKLLQNGNFYVQGQFDEATYDPASSYTKNLCPYSQSYVITGNSNTGWRATNGTTIINTNELAPDGTPTAARIRLGPYTYSSIDTAFCWLPNLTQVGSMWVRVDSGTRQFALGLNGGGANASFTATTTWTRFSTGAYSKIVNYSDGLNIYANDGVAGGDVLIWGAQIEIGNAATDYEPTGASSYVYIPPGFTTRTDPTGFYTVGSFDEVGINPTANLPVNLVYASTTWARGAFTYWSTTGNNDSLYPTVATLAPDGTFTAVKQVFPTNGSQYYQTATGQGHWAVNGGSLPGTIGTTYTFSVFAKSAEWSWLGLQFYDFVTGSVGCEFNLGTGVAGTPNSNITSSISNAGNGWYRCSITITVGQSLAKGGGINSIYIYGNPTGSGFITSDGVSGIYLWGPQLEIGAAPTNYIPTTTTPTLGLYAQVPKFVQRVDRTGLHRIAGQYDEVSYNPASGYIKNGIPYSTTINNTVWNYDTNSGPYGTNVFPATMSASTEVLAPDGTMTATKLISLSGSTGHHLTAIRNFVGAGSLGVYTFSIYAKAAEWGYLQIDNDPSGGANYNLLTGTVIGTGGFQSVTIVPVGNGWYRCACTWNAYNNSNYMGSVILDIQNTTTVASTGDGVSGIYVWGPQYELGPYATEYVPTGANSIPLT